MALGVWQMTNPDAIDFPSGGISSESLIQQKKKSFQRRQTVLRNLSNKEQAKRKLPLRSRKLARADLAEEKFRNGLLRFASDFPKFCNGFNVKTEKGKELLV
ncbi:DDT domain-containing protein [Abeliophyllum distichum]|uniref:DDT domain-containing protein n=1 Tax=Abeliophyllum distichum TaxID=126358 RepID=A0ABD1SZR9_9LAMI